MSKIYYNENGWVCQRYPYDFKITDENRYIEVSEEEESKTFVSSIGKAWRVISGVLTEQAYDTAILSQEEAKVEMQDIKAWFDNTYTYQEQKYRRLAMLNKADDDGIDGNTKLIALYEEAEKKRQRIQELEKL